MPRYSIDRPIAKAKANPLSQTPPQWPILLVLRKLNGERGSEKNPPRRGLSLRDGVREVISARFQKAPRPDDSGIAVEKICGFVI